MEIRHYLAMTAAEIAAVPTLPEKCAWMACHFSPYGTGLSNLPSALSAGSLLILNDRIPICGHDPRRIAAQLRQSAEALGCFGVLLDFQQEDSSELKALSRCLTEVLPFPVIVCDTYAPELDCPVFVRPCPHHIPLQEHIVPWSGRELWLDLAANAQTLLLTKNGTHIRPHCPGDLPSGGYAEEALHCHYAIAMDGDCVRFTFWRTEDDLTGLTEEAERLGITTFVGLYQERQQKTALHNAERF